MKRKAPILFFILFKQICCGYKLFVPALFVVGFYNLHGQDLQFSQFYAIPIHLSPSFAGASDGQRVVANYRNQWPEIPHAYETYAISYDRYFFDIKSGAGILVTHDRKGELGMHTTGLGLVYNYDFRVWRELHARPALEFQYSLEGINLDKILTREMILSGSSTSQPAIKRNVGYFDAAFSMLFYTGKIWFGTTINHLMQPNYTFALKESMPVRFSIFTGYKLVEKGKLVKPKEEHLFFAFNYRQMVQFSQFDIGLLGHKKNFNLGFWYRGIPFIKENKGSDAIIVLAGFVKDQYTFGISYDITISTLQSYTNGAVEFSASYIFPNPLPKKKRTMIPCPVF